MRYPLGILQQQHQVVEISVLVTSLRSEISLALKNWGEYSKFTMDVTTALDIHGLYAKYLPQARDGAANI